MTSLEDSVWEGFVTNLRQMVAPAEVKNIGEVNWFEVPKEHPITHMLRCNTIID